MLRPTRPAAPSSTARRLRAFGRHTRGLGLAAVVALALSACAVPTTVFVSDAGPVAPPPWLEVRAQWSWDEIEGTSLALGPPGVAGAGGAASNRIDAWAGLAIDERRGTVYLAASGGRDYAGNEVLALPLAEATPRWITVLPSSPSELFTTTAYGLDGRPSSRQTFHRPVFVERRGRLVLFGGDTLTEELHEVDGFDPVRAAWDPPGSYPPIPYDGDGEEPAVVEDPETGDVWLFGDYSVHRWIESTNRWAAVVPSGLIQSGYGFAAALDTRRHRILLVGSGTGDAYTFGVDDASWTDHGPIELGDVSGGAMVFVRGAAPEDDVFLVRGSWAGARVIAIDPETLAPADLPTSGGDAIPASIYGIFGRFRLAPSLGGVVFYPRYEGNVWFLRTAPSAR